jgi:hypothetical protein
MDTVYFKCVSRDTSINNSSLIVFFFSKILQDLCSVEDPVITRLLGIAKLHK